MGREIGKKKSSKKKKKRPKPGRGKHTLTRGGAVTVGKTKTQNNTSSVEKTTGTAYRGTQTQQKKKKGGGEKREAPVKAPRRLAKEGLEEKDRRVVKEKNGDRREAGAAGGTSICRCQGQRLCEKKS